MFNSDKSARITAPSKLLRSRQHSESSTSFRPGILRLRSLPLDHPRKLRSSKLNLEQTCVSLTGIHEGVGSSLIADSLRAASYLAPNPCDRPSLLARLLLRARLLLCPPTGVTPPPLRGSCWGQVFHPPRLPLRHTARKKNAEDFHLIPSCAGTPCTLSFRRCFPVTSFSLFIPLDLLVCYNSLAQDFPFSFAFCAFLQSFFTTLLMPWD